MQISIDGSSAKSAASTLFALVVLFVASVVDVTRSVVSRATSATRRSLAVVETTSRRFLSERDAIPVDRAARTLRTAFLGRRLDVSATVLVIAPALALASNYWARSVGYVRIRNWVNGTWYGTDPRLVVFLGVAALLALAVLSAASNSGLLPTTFLVTAPVFGIAAARYGLVLEHYGTIGVPNAVSVGVVLAVAFGVPIACAGFVLGTIARRTVRTLRGRDGEAPNVERA